MTPFWKLHGLGNDFALFRHEDCPDPSADLISQLCDRKHGIGSDGLITVAPGDPCSQMRIWNPDGSPSEMCGNGLRCAALWLDVQESVSRPRLIGLGGRDHLIEPVRAGFQVQMGRPSFDPADICLRSAEPWRDRPNPIAQELGLTTAVAYGNPHLVWFVEELPPDWQALGAKTETHPEFLRRTNVHFVIVENESHARMWTWERGAGPTLACGSGACAVAAAGNATGRLGDSVRMTLPGGELLIQLTEAGTIMTGPACLVYRGSWPALL